MVNETEEWHELMAGEMPRLISDKLEPFGFTHEGSTYNYEADLLAGSFRLYVRVNESGAVAWQFPWCLCGGTFALCAEYLWG